MKALYLAFQIILLATAGVILFTEGYIFIPIFIFIVAFERFVPLYKQFYKKPIFKTLINEGEYYSEFETAGGVQVTLKGYNKENIQIIKDQIE